METEVKSLLTDAHAKLDVIKSHMPKIILAVIVLAVVVSVVHMYFGHSVGT